MNKGYWIVAYRSISDQAKVKAYAELARAPIEAAGGRALVFNTRPAVEEAGVQLLTVVIEFPSVEAAREAYASPAYAASLVALGDGAERDFRIVEGLPQQE